MSAGELRERAAALRAAGERLRRRPAAEVALSLGAVLERWRDPCAAERVRLEAELPAATGFHGAGVREGLELGLGPWSAEAWRELVGRELGPEPGLGAPLSAVLLAGSLPLPTLLGVIAPLALRSPVLVKAASRDPLTPVLVAESIAAIDPGLADCVAVCSFAHGDDESLRAFLEADCIVATGSDAAVDAIAARVPVSRRVLRHGHGVSLALLGPEACEGELLEATGAGLALDTALWDQLGCLSPQAVFAAGDTESCHEVTRALAAALGEVGQRLPRGEVPEEARALTEHERASAELRAAAGSGALLCAGADWTAVCEADATPRANPLYRFLRVHPLDESGLERQLAPWAPYLSGVALAGFGARGGALRDRLKKLGATRVCEPGTLQAPPLGWPRDGLPVLASLRDPSKPD